MSALPTCGVLTRQVADPNAAPLREASDLVRGLSYGEVRIVVTGGKITAVEATEKRVYNTRQKD